MNIRDKRLWDGQFQKSSPSANFKPQNSNFQSKLFDLNSKDRLPSLSTHLHVKKFLHDLPEKSSTNFFPSDTHKMKNGEKYLKLGQKRNCPLNFIDLEQEKVNNSPKMIPINIKPVVPSNLRHFFFENKIKKNNDNTLQTTKPENCQKYGTLIDPIEISSEKSFQKKYYVNLK